MLLLDYESYFVRLIIIRQEYTTHFAKCKQNLISEKFTCLDSSRATPPPHIQNILQCSLKKKRVFGLFFSADGPNHLSLYLKVME